MTNRHDVAEEQWKRLMSGEQPSQVMSVPASRQVQTPHEIKADERTRAVREMTDEAAGQRLANVARLKQARLNKEAHNRSQAASTVPATKRRGSPAK